MFLTEESEQLEPADLLLAAVALFAAVSRQVSEVVQLEQVDDGNVDQLLRAEGFLQDQPLHTHTRARSSHTDFNMISHYKTWQSELCRT